MRACAQDERLIKFMMAEPEPLTVSAEFDEEAYRADKLAERYRLNGEKRVGKDRWGMPKGD